MRLLKFVITTLITAALAAGMYTAWQQGVFTKFSEQAIEQTAHIIQEGEKQLSLPQPLRGPLTLKPTLLTTDGVFIATNQARSTNGKKPLTRNATLDKAAAAKVNDMFAQQYFEHENPQGKGPSDVITAAGYNYLTVGENLALGNFGNDTALVEAWMNSPGHRANILNPDFQEIGIAVKQGTFEGKSVWLAVQEFGTAQNVCPSPAKNISVAIETNKTTLNKMQAEIQNQHPETQEEVDAYNQKVDAYNALVAKTKELVTSYNSQVKTYNTCLNSYTDKQ
jgi:uncharacterized protein YkwD